MKPLRVYVRCAECCVMRPEASLEEHAGLQRCRDRVFCVAVQQQNLPIAKGPFTNGVGKTH